MRIRNDIVSIPSKCLFCGKDFIITNKYRPQKFCSRSCGTHYRHAHTGHTKEDTERRIRDFIRGKGRYCSYPEIQQELHITDKTFAHWNISYSKLNEKEGYFASERLKKNHIARQALLSGKYHCLSEALKDLGFSKKDVDLGKIKTTELLAKIGITRSSAKFPTKESLETAIINEIRHEGAQIPAAELVKRLHFDYALVVKYGIRLYDMHVKAGVKYFNNTSYNELRFLKKAKRIFKNVYSQYKFNDCRSTITGRRLQFDFFIEDVNTLVEIDGEQHSNKSHLFYSQKLKIHDEIKNEYARRKDIRLIRISVCPVEDFEERIDSILEQIKSGSCKTH